MYFHAQMTFDLSRISTSWMVIICWMTLCLTRSQWRTRRWWPLPRGQPRSYPRSSNPSCYLASQIRSGPRWTIFIIYMYIVTHKLFDCFVQASQWPSDVLAIPKWLYFWYRSLSYYKFVILGWWNTYTVSRVTYTDSCSSYLNSLRLVQIQARYPSVSPYWLYKCIIYIYGKDPNFNSRFRYSVSFLQNNFSKHIFHYKSISIYV